MAERQFYSIQELWNRDIAESEMVRQAIASGDIRGFVYQASHISELLSSQDSEPGEPKPRGETAHSKWYFYSGPRRSPRRDRYLLLGWFEVLQRSRHELAAGGDVRLLIRPTPAPEEEWVFAFDGEIDWVKDVWVAASDVPDVSKEGAGSGYGWSFDPGSPHYPRELDVAMQAWRAASTRPDTPGSTPKQKIEHWIEKFDPELDSAAKQRIAQICNWNKGGGRPRQG